MTERAKQETYRGAAKRILELQRDDGSIPWTEHGVFDAWNHAEGAMALWVMGERDAAARAREHLRRTQNSDGSWWGVYGEATAHEGGGMRPMGDRLRDTNHAAYVASLIACEYLLTDDVAAVRRHWPMVEAAIDFALAHQTPEGDIRWAAKEARTPEEDALLTGCSSIYKSLEAALRLASLLGVERPKWREGRRALGQAIRDKPHRFDRQWPSNARFSMDWYYPVLAQAIVGDAAHERLKTRWADFVVEGFGCRCVDDAPWATVAESCELAIALLVLGRRDDALRIFGEQAHARDETGAYWMGWQYERDVFWPAERASWTCAAVILAGDALYGWTPAARLFTSPAREPIGRLPGV